MTAMATRLRFHHRAGSLRLTLITLGVMLVGAASLLDQFLRGENLSNLLAQSTALVIAAVGQMFVLVTGGLDISVGAIISLTTAILTLDLPGVMRVALAFIMAVAFGLINGIGVARLKVHPIIMTLATMGIAQGLSFIVLPIPGGQIPGFVSALVTGSVGPVPASLLWMVVASLAAAWILYRTPLGLYIYAVGGNVDNARLNGVKVERTIVMAYVLSAVFACVAGLFLAGRLASGDPKGGAEFGIESVTAAALGGVHLAGGVGSVFGTVAGAAILGVVNNVMNLTNLSAFLQSVVKGALLLALVVSQRRKSVGL